MTLDPIYEELIRTQARCLAERLQELGLHPASGDTPALADAQMRAITDAIGLLALGHGFESALEELVERARREDLSIHARKTVTVTLLQGTLELDSPYLYDRETKRSARPLKDHFGLSGRSRSESVERALSDFGAHDSFAQAKRRFERHYPASIGDSAPRDSTLEAARGAAAFVDEKLGRMARAYDLPPSARRARADAILAQSDGCLLRTGELVAAREAPGRAEALGAGPAEIERVRRAAEGGAARCRIQIWREAHSGLVRRKDEVEPSVLARRCPRSEAVGDLFRLSCSHGLHFETEVLAIGDGGAGLKRGFEEHFARASYLLDWRHMEVEHLQETAHALGMEPALARRWARVRIERMARGEAIEVLGALGSDAEAMRPEPGAEAPPGYERLCRLLKYVEKYVYCVAYDAWREAGWPIGSSEVESLHKRLIQKRMKLAGACWREENLDPMLALRTVALNEGWWEEFWEWEHERRREARKERSAA